MRLSNTARSVSEVAPHASLFIPIAIPSLDKLPRYVSLDSHSQWHTSALLSTAVESMTLPSRLKVQNGSLQRLDQFENALNINGSQNIAKLRMSIEDKPEPNDHHQPRTQEIRARSRDTRLPSQERGSHESRPVHDEDLTVLDIDFFPTDEQLPSRGRGTSKRIHVFGQAECYRGNEDRPDEAEGDEDEGYIRARQRAAGRPVVQK